MRKRNRDFITLSSLILSLLSAAVVARGHERAALPPSKKPQIRVLAQRGLKERDRVAKLPGQPDDVDFAQYSGYVTVDEESERNLFYYFVEARSGKGEEDPPSAKPLLLWLNGGPGASSLSGAMQEIGPFRVYSDGKTLYHNQYSWNNVGHLLFLENVPGVGFTSTKNASDLKLPGDARTAEDSYAFLLNWFQRFPEHRGREFYIAGESYGGHFVPQLAALVHTRNKAAHGGNATINLKGIAIGNGLLNDETDARGMFEFWGSRGLLTDGDVQRARASCDLKTRSFLEEILHPRSQECREVLGKMAVVNAGQDPFNIYGPLCPGPAVTALPNVGNATAEASDPCGEQYLVKYFNLPEVQQAMHAKPTVWARFSNEVIGNWQDSAKSMLPILKQLLSDGIQVLVYSGDVDGRVPMTATKYSLEALHLPITSPWTPWRADSNQISGFTMTYAGNLTFATVKGAGHQAPADRPRAAARLVKFLLQGEPLTFQE